MGAQDVMSGGMAKRSAAMCRVRRNMPAPSAWAWHPETEGPSWKRH